MDPRKRMRYLFLLFAILLIATSFKTLPTKPLDCATVNSWWCTIATTLRPVSDHSSDKPHHPLDPLTLRELTLVRTILSSHALFKSNVHHALHSVVLDEPPKKVVLKWKEGERLPPRHASVVARVGGESHVLRVELDTGRVVRVGSGPESGYPVMTIEDMTWSTWAPFKSKEFNRSVVGRGVDLADVACLPISPDGC